ncbi:MAG: hypothetical protein ACT4PP_05395 [Sporichthyaceae bacterium]
MTALPGPRSLGRAAQSYARRAGALVTGALRLPGRVIALADEAEDLLARLQGTLGRVDGTVDHAAMTARRAGALLDDTAAVVTRTDLVLESTELTVARTQTVIGESARITTQAARTIATASAITDTCAVLVDRLAPAMEKAAPLLERFVTGLTEAEVDAAIAMVDELPVLARSLRESVVPILTTLDRVGPDLTELLQVSDDVRRAIVGIPGFGFFKKRGAEILEDEDEDDDEDEDEDDDEDSRVGSTPAG